MPLVKINSVAGNLGDNPDAGKKVIATKIAQVLADEMGLSTSDVWVVFEDIDAADWFVGPESVRELRSKTS